MQTKAKFFSIVIPTRDEGKMLHMTVDSILSNTDYPAGFEIIIVDDGSTDGSCDRYEADERHISLIRTKNQGVAKARNLGAKHAKGEYLLFLDAHCKVSSNWLDRFATSLNRREVAVVGPTFTKLDATEPKGCGMMWVNDKAMRFTWFTPIDADEPYKMALTPGGCQAFRKDTFFNIGQYDDGFESWGSEDLEICLRSWVLGYSVLVDPKITIQHYFRQSRSFEVLQEDVVYNFLRLINFHFSKKRIDKIMETLASYPHLKKVMDRIQKSDVFEMRKALNQVRVRDDDWFFQSFQLQGKPSVISHFT
ncbi:MAG: glycosyltransferase [Bacteroidia bacterium]|nr:glycosyltransferase [Bacteroidia bacterium]